MTDGPAFFRAIEAQPDDDTPRLVYADWLDENATSDADRARAEFIRVQCELARDPMGDRKTALAARAYELLNEYREQWSSAYPFPLARHHGYVRGFILPDLPAADFAKHGEALAAVTPLNVVRLRKARRAMADVAACPALRHVRSLYLEGNALRNQHLPALLDSPHLTNVRVLALGNNSIGIAGCETLAETAALPALRVLTLRGNPIKGGGLEALAGAPRFANLVGLHVSNCEVTAASLIRFARLPAVSELRSLDVNDHDRDDTTARAILDSPHLSKLARLWHPERDLSDPVRAELDVRFGANLNPRSYYLDWSPGGAA